MCIRFVCVAVLLSLFISNSNAAASGTGENAIADEAQIIKLTRHAKAGNADAAFNLAGILESKAATDPDGHNAGYWYEIAARAGHIGALLTIGYSKRYTAETIVTCNGTSMKITSMCDPISRNGDQAHCYKQTLEFFDGRHKSTSKHIARYSNYRKDLSVAVNASCVQGNKEFYYVIYSYDFGGSCCEWQDIFSRFGKYVGSTAKKSYFGCKYLSERKMLELGLADLPSILDHKRVNRINLYPYAGNSSRSGK